ncbi:MAG TPA: Fe-S cluster assembly scaffold protein NifU [Clostridiaceae bacterium]|nr:Fe-S cluster assembly scaffold protein NifU [Clostridiaceae bacterium]
MYSEKVMDHFMNPRNVGEIENADGVGQVGNPKCGDIMKMYLKIENNVIVDAKFKTFGCGAAVATSSMATEMIKGKTVEEALKITNKAVADALDGLPPVKMHCSNLAEEAIKAAIEDYLKKNGITSVSTDCNICCKKCDDFEHEHYDDEQDDGTEMDKCQRRK